MDWNKGFSALYYASVVDPTTWKDIDRFEIVSGSISREDSSLRESADIECVDYDGNKEQWVRIWLNTKQNGASGHVALFTGLATSPDIDINGVLFSNKVQCYSVLKPAEDIVLNNGWYAPAGMTGAEIVRELLSATPAPKIISDDSPVLSQAIIAEKNETCLSMAGKILDAINWRIRITGDGTINICPKANKISATFDSLENDIIEPELTVSADWFSRPNVFMAVSGDVSAIARDDSEDSMLSTVNRGREVWKTESNCDLNDNESVEEYALRRLKEEQAYAYTVSYSRRYNPDILVGDIVQMIYPAQNIQGNFEVTSQDIDLEYGASTSEKVKRYG